MSLLACAVAMFCPYRTLTSLLVPISILPFLNSFAHIFWMYNYTHDVCIHKSCTVTNAVQQRNSDRDIRNFEKWIATLRPSLWLQHSHKSNTNASWTFYCNEKYLVTFVFKVFEILLLPVISACVSKQPVWLASLLGFFFFIISWLPVKQLNMLISCPREWFL